MLGRVDGAGRPRGRLNLRLVPEAAAAVPAPAEAAGPSAGAGAAGGTGAAGTGAAGAGTAHPRGARGPYHERATAGDTCRVHALNVMLGAHVIDPPDLRRAALAWQRSVGAAGGRSELSFFGPGGTSALTSILAAHGRPTFVNLGLGKARALLDLCAGARGVDALLDAAGRYLLYTATHVFGVVRHTDGAGTCDSGAGGPRRGRPLPTRRHGMVVPLDAGVAALREVPRGSPLHPEAASIVRRFAGHTAANCPEP